MNTFAMEKKLLAPMVLTKNLIDEEFGSCSMEIINLDCNCKIAEEETNPPQQGSYHFGGQSVISLFSSHMTLKGSVVIQQPQDLGVCSINLLDSSMKDTLFQRVQPCILKKKYSDYEQQQSIEGIQMNIDDGIDQQFAKRDCARPLIVNEISHRNCSILDSDSD